MFLNKSFLLFMPLIVSSWAQSLEGNKFYVKVFVSRGQALLIVSSPRLTGQYFTFSVAITLTDSRQRNDGELVIDLQKKSRMFFLTCSVQHLPWAYDLGERDSLD